MTRVVTKGKPLDEDEWRVEGMGVLAKLKSAITHPENAK
jgi:hypothetical protein